MPIQKILEDEEIEEQATGRHDEDSSSSTPLSIANDTVSLNSFARLCS
jgi:hypothetical protein